MNQGTNPQSEQYMIDWPKCQRMTYVPKNQMQKVECFFFADAKSRMLFFANAKKKIEV